MSSSGSHENCFYLHLEMCLFSTWNTEILDIGSKAWHIPITYYLFIQPLFIEGLRCARPGNIMVSKTVYGRKRREHRDRVGKGKGTALVTSAASPWGLAWLGRAFLQQPQLS